MPSEMQVIYQHDMKAPRAALTGPGEIPGLWHFTRPIPFPGAPSENP